MIGDLTLEKLLCKYGIDGKKIIKNNPNILEYGEYEEIEKIVNLSIWKTHPNLLTPSVFFKTAGEIEKRYNIIINDLKEESFLNPTIMYRNSIQEMLAKINYIKENNLPLVVNGKINSIFGMSDANLQKKYGISKKELKKKYSITLDELKEKYYKEGSSK